MKLIPFFVFTLGCALLTACSPSKPTPAAQTGNAPDSPNPGAQTGKLQGSAFIVTLGGENIKLGLLTVKAIEEKPLLDYLAKTDLAAEEITTALRGVLANYQGELKAAQEAQAKADQRAMDLKKLADDTAQKGGFGYFDSRPEISPEEANALADLQADYAHYEQKGWHTLAADYARDVTEHQKTQALIIEQQKSWDQWRPTFDQQWNDYQAARENAASLTDELNGAQYRLARAETRLEQWLGKDRSFAMNLDTMPAPIATAVTDADGKFSLELPLHGRFGIAASAERAVGDDTEKYLWLIWVSLDGANSKTVMLDNDNMINSAKLDSGDRAISSR